MKTKIMAHVTTGSRNGWGTAAPFLRGALSFMADAFLEMSMSAYRIWRHAGYDWQGNVNLDIFPGFDQLKIEDMPEQAAYWWPIIQAQALAEENRLGIKFDAIKVTNEVGGGGSLPDTDYALMKLVAYEQAILPLAEADGRTILVANCATDSPQWDDWQNIIAPFVIEAAGRGHIYSRHAYADNIGGLDYLIKDGNLQTGGARPFKELAYFRSLGYRIPTVLGELGFYSFPGTAHFIAQIGQYDNLMQAYPELGGGCLFTYGVWLDANIEDASIALADYLRVRPYILWMPEFVDENEPEPPPTDQTWEQRAWAASVAEQIARGIPLNPAAGLQSQIFTDGLVPVHREIGVDGIAIQAAESLDGQTPRRVYAWQSGKPVWWIGDPDVEPPPTEPTVTNITDQLPTHPTLEYEQRPLSAITTLTIHHTVSPPDRSIESIASYHVNSNGWPGIGYHFVIKDDGRIFQTNALTTKSYHAGSYAAPGDENYFSVGIALQGDFTNSPPPQAQQDAAKWLVNRLSSDLTNANTVLGHRQMPGAQTQCPGNTWAQWLPYVAGGLVAEPTPPPLGETYVIDFLRADPQAWRVIRRADGSGEDVWDLPTADGFVRVKNAVNGEFYSADGRKRFVDNDPAPDSQGNARIYIQTTSGAPGGEIAPDVAEMGKIYTFYSDVQFYAKSNCQPLDENSGKNVPSTFQLVDVIDNYEFPTTGFVVDRLYITMQTGEKQLYAIKDGRKLGWVGGGASQAGNTWAGELAELYLDRAIPQGEPNKYCS